LSWIEQDAYLEQMIQDQPWLGTMTRFQTDPQLDPQDVDGIPTADPPRQLDGGRDTGIFGSMPSTMGWTVEND
jgi:hypothetical protein